MSRQGLDRETSCQSREPTGDLEGAPSLKGTLTAQLQLMGAMQGIGLTVAVRELDSEICFKTVRNL